MRLSVLVSLVGLTSTFAAVLPGGIKERATPISPKVFIFSLFSDEANVWYDHTNIPGTQGSITGQTIPVPGFSPLFPNAYCDDVGDVCQLTTGEAEINAAATIAALVFSGLFDLTTTYFLIAGIAGINPKQGGTGSIAFSKFAVQVGLQYEFDAREMPENFTTGYFAQGTAAPDQYPTPSDIYGTEVFELNEPLRDIAMLLVTTGGAGLVDSPAGQAYRNLYSVDSVTNYIKTATTPISPQESSSLMALAAQYTDAVAAPAVIPCDTATSDQYFSGVMLGEAFEATLQLWTGNLGFYCMTAQEDNAILEVLLRAAIAKLADFSRIILMRSASDFDRPYPGQSPLDNLYYDNDGAYEDSVQNIYIAGSKVVSGILAGWDTQFAAGVEPNNYIGDIFGSLGGTPNFGPGTTQEPIGIDAKGDGSGLGHKKHRKHR